MDDTLYPTNITFGVTNQCTAACANCSGAYNQNPVPLQFLTSAQMCARIDEAFKLGWTLPSGICFTGGEALIQKKDVLQTSVYARKKGVKNISLMSNGSWGRNLAHARDLAQELKNSGIDEVYFSTGHDHQQFIDEQSIINAVHACQSARIYTQIDVEADIKHKAYKSLVTNKSLQGITIEKMEWIAWKTKEVRDTAPNIISIRESSGCHNLLDSCYIDQDNVILPCCGQFCNFMPRMILGKNLQNWYDRNWLHIWLAVDGPHLLWSLFNKTGEYAYHRCQACFIIQSIDEYYRAAWEMWPQHRDSVIYRYNYICSLLRQTRKLQKEGIL